MTNKHTPGPWKVEEVHNLQTQFFINADCYKDGIFCIAEIPCPIGSPNVKEHKANAHLIAAAPDLLEALEHVLPFMEDMAGSGNKAEKKAVKIMQSAIKKAKQK